MLRKLAFITFALFALTSSLLAQAGWLMRGFSTNRTSANQSETVLNQSNVNTGQFGLLFSRQLDGQVYAQPLVVPNVKIPGKGTFNVLYVATMHDSVYAFDADNPGNTQPLWQRSFIDPANGVTSIPYYYLTGEMDIHPEVGIVSTPAVDTTSNTIYVVARTLEGDPNVDSNYIQRIWALDLATGAPKFGSPAVISATFPGNADGGTTVAYNGRRENQRPALVLNKGRLYIASASHGDQQPYHGWILSYNATTLARLSAFCTTPNGYEGGIWMSGQGMPIDASGDLYAATGNGGFNVANSNYGDTLLKLNWVNLTVADYFTPYNQASLDAYDIDLGVSGPILLPGTGLLVQGSKEGKLYVVNSSKMGKFDSAGDDQIVQWWWACSGLIYAPPAFWDGGANGQNLYVWSSYDVLKGFAFNGKTFKTTPFATGAFYAENPGGMISVSSNGADPKTAIVWATAPFSGDANQNTVPGILHAFRASDLTELYNSRMYVNDDYGNLAKFNPPAVVNGKVYVPTFSNQLAVYGELPHVAPLAVGLTGEAGNGQIALTWQNARGATAYLVERGPVGGPYTTIATAPPTGIYVDTGLTNGKTYAYRVVSKGLWGTSVQSNEASDTPATEPGGTGSGLKGYYYNDPGDGTRFRTLALTRLDKTINFTWNGASPGGSVGGTDFSVTWYGAITAPATGYYSFMTTSDDGVRLWVRGGLAINDWTDHGATNDTSAPILLVAGKRYPIQLEYFQDGGGDQIQLYWSASASPGFSLVPATALFAYSSGIPTYDAALDMSANFNLDGMSYLANPTDGNIQYLQETFASEVMPRTSTFGLPGAIPFIIGPGYDGAQNIIECHAQTVLTPAYMASTVYLLATAVNFDQLNNVITFNYSDGTSSSDMLNVTDWGYATPQNRELLAKNFNVRHNPQGALATPTSIFRYALPIDPTRHLISITLPTNIDIKVLSISVVR